MLFSIIVPCFNEEENLRPFLQQVKKEMGELITDTELIFIDDGSRDGTLNEVKALGEEESFTIRALSFSRNFGKEAGLFAGLSEAQGDYVGIIDADLQQNPKYLKEMLEFLRENPDYDCVAAYQKVRKEGKLLSFFKGVFYGLINRLTDVEFYRSASDFRVLTKKMAKAIVAMPERCRFSKGIFSWVGFRTHYIPYEVAPRFAGKSKWNFWSLASYAINGIVGFSDKPLIIASVMGLVLFVISILLMLWVVIKTILFGDPVAGFPTLCSLILLLSGIQLLCMGILGQYLAKIHEESKNRPLYIVREEYDNKKE